MSKNQKYVKMSKVPRKRHLIPSGSQNNEHIAAECLKSETKRPYAKE